MEQLLVGNNRLYGIIGDWDGAIHGRNANIYATLITLARFISMLVLLILSQFSSQLQQIAHARKSAGARPCCWIRFRPTSASMNDQLPLH